MEIINDISSFLNYDIKKEMHFEKALLLVLNNNEELNFNFFKNIREVEIVYHTRIEVLVNGENEFIIRIDFI